MSTPFLGRRLAASLLAVASLAGCAATADDASQSSSAAATAFPAQCPQFATGHVAKGSWGGDARGCVIERCQPGWANAEADDGRFNPYMKGRYETGILGMIDDKKDGCETRLSTLLAQRSAPAGGVENLGEIAGDEVGKRLKAYPVGNHVFRVRVKETNSGLPKPARIIVGVTHYETMPYKVEVTAARGDGPAKPCTGALETVVRSDPEHDKEWKSRDANKLLDFSAVKAVTDYAALEVADVPLRDDTFDLFVKVSLADPSQAQALGDPGYMIEVEQDSFSTGKMPMRCEP
jgi:hypothetical protein